MPVLEKKPPTVIGGRPVKQVKNTTNINTLLQKCPECNDTKLYYCSVYSGETKKWNSILNCDSCGWEEEIDLVPAKELELCS